MFLQRVFVYAAGKHFKKQKELFLMQRTFEKNAKKLYFFA